MKIESHAMRRAVAAETFKFFVPFCEDGTIGEAIMNRIFLAASMLRSISMDCCLAKIKKM